MAKTTSKSKVGHYATYKATNRWHTNRKQKLLRAAKAQPNNEDIKDALVNIKYRRKTPKTRVWSHSAIRYARLYKRFMGHASIDLFSSNPKTVIAALSVHPSKQFVNVPDGKVSFSLGARAHDGQGNMVWA